MGYDSTSFTFYGIQIEKLDWDLRDALELYLQNTPYEHILTGSQAIGPVHDFIGLRASYFKISDNRYDHIHHKSIVELSEECGLAEYDPPVHESAIMKVIEDMNLTPIGQRPQWFVAAFGG